MANRFQTFINKVGTGIKNLVPAPSDITQWQWYIPQRKKPTPTNLDTYIAPVQLQRFRQDVLTWRSAMSQAENSWYPHRVDMQRMYYDTILNGHVTACIEKRKNLTMLREWCVVDKDGNENEQVNALFNSIWFNEFINYTLEAKFFGYSLVRIGDIINGEITECSSIRRHNVSPDRRNVTQYTYSISGIPFDEEPYSFNHIFVSTPSDVGVSPCGYGLLYKVGIYEIMMRNLMGYNGDYIELFGMPTRVAKTTKMQGDPEREQLENMMELMGSRGWAILDPTDELEFIQSSAVGSSNNPYENLEKRCMAFISKVLLGHADALDSTAGKLGATQGEESPTTQALEDIMSVDAKFVENVINAQLLPKLRGLGFKIPDGFKFKFMNNSEMLEAKQRTMNAQKQFAEILQTLKGAGYEVDAEFVSEQLQMPVEKAMMSFAPLLNKHSDKVQNKLNEIYG
ncbi:MAG: phage portal protein family protein [Gaiellales bacterium]